MADPFLVNLPATPINVGDPGHAGIETSQVDAIVEVRSRLADAEDALASIDVPEFTAVGTALAEASDAAAARTAIGAGTSNLEIGTTGSTAKAGNWQPEISDVTGLGAALDGKVGSAVVTTLLPITQEDYDALAEKDPSTLYLITE